MRSQLNRRGAAVVEFAILLVLILLVLSGVVEFGFLWLQSHYINNAAREGARVAAKLEDPVTENSDDNNAVKQAVIDYLASLYPRYEGFDANNCCGCTTPSSDPDGICIQIEDPGGEVDTAGYRVTVKVQIIRIFGGSGSWFFSLFSPADTGDTMTGSAFFADETP